MSKAFTKESDDEGDDLEDAPLLLPDGAKNYMTPAGARAFAEELKSLGEERSGLVRDDSTAAKQRLRALDRRMRFLQKRLELVEVVEPTASPPERAVFGTLVTLVDEEGAKRSFRIVGIDEADPARGLISWISPIAKALLGRRRGEAVTLRTPKGDEELEIESIEG